MVSRTELFHKGLGASAACNHYVMWWYEINALTIFFTGDWCKWVTRITLNDIFAVQVRNPRPIFNGELPER